MKTESYIVPGEVPIRAETKGQYWDELQAHWRRVDQDTIAYWKKQAEHWRLLYEEAYRELQRVGRR